MKVRKPLQKDQLNSNPVHKEYASSELMIADQSNQTGGYLYYNGQTYWEYLGTTNGDISDYRNILDAGIDISKFVPYIGADKNTDLGDFDLKANQFLFDTTPVSPSEEQGAMYWDEDDNTVAVVLNGHVMKVGEDVFYPVTNQTGSTITKGTACGFDGTIGASGRLRAKPFLANGSEPSEYFMGVAAEDILNGQEGKVLWFGRIKKLNTNAFENGDILYVSTSSAGGFQTTVPKAPNNIIQVAAVINKSINQGVIFVRPTIGSNIIKDEGVKIDTPLNNQSIVYNSTTSLFENKITKFNVKDAAGDTKFSVENESDLRFEGAGDTSISFNGTTRSVIISSTGGISGGTGVVSFNGRDGAVTSQSGDYNTSQVAEVTNLYFTEARVRSTPLTGFSADNTPIVSTDSVLVGFNKAQGQINARALAARGLSINGSTGRITVTGGSQDLTADRTWVVDLNTSGVSAGSYNNVTVDTYGRVTDGSNVSYLTGNQTITLSGDVTGSGDTSIITEIGDNKVTTAKILDANVTLEKIANIGANTILGNNTANPAAPIALTAAQVRTLINVADGATANTGTVTSIATNNGITGGTITTTGTLGLTGQALALHNLASNGFIVRTGAGTVAGRQLVEGTGIAISSPDGVAGNPTISVIFGTTDGTIAQGNHTHDASSIISGTLPIARGGTNSGTALTNNRVMVSSGGAIVVASAITANRALISNANGIPTHSTVTNTELGYLSGVTSAIQTQLNGKEPTITAGTTGQYYRGDKTFQTLNTAAIPELTNLYFTDARARAAISLTTTGNSGDATYNNATGVFNIPNYTLAGLGGVPNTRTITINGTSLDLSANRSWSVGTVTGSGTTNFLTKFTGAGSIGNSLVFDNGTNVGIGTVDPQQKLTVNGNILAQGVGNGFLLDTTGSQFTNGIKVVNDFETVLFSGRGSAGYFIAGDNNLRFGFGTNYSAGEVARFLTNGNLLIGTTSELTGGGRLQVNGDGRFTGDVIAFSSSDARLKDNLTKITNPIEKILKLGGYSFTWNDKQDTYTGNDYGVIAQEVESVFPELVQTRDNGMKAVKYDKLVPLLIEAIKELSNKVKVLEGGK